MDHLDEMSGAVRDFDADKTIGAARGIEHRAQDIGGIADVFNGELFENFAGRVIPTLQRGFDGIIVLVGLADRVPENRWI